MTAAAASRPRALARALQLPRTAWLPLTLIGTATLAPIVSIHSVGWAPGTEVLLSVALVAILFGFALSRSRLASPWIILIGLVSDLGVAYVVASEAFPGPLDGIRNFVLLFGDTVEWVQLRQAGNLVREQPLASGRGRERRAAARPVLPARDVVPGRLRVSGQPRQCGVSFLDDDGRVGHGLYGGLGGFPVAQCLSGHRAGHAGDRSQRHLRGSGLAAVRGIPDCGPWR